MHVLQQYQQRQHGGQHNHLAICVEPAAQNTPMLTGMGPQSVSSLENVFRILIRSGQPG
jgi:hypothetical protein